MDLELISVLVVGLGRFQVGATLFSTALRLFLPPAIHFHVVAAAQDFRDGHVAEHLGALMSQKKASELYDVSRKTLARRLRVGKKGVEHSATN